MALVYRHIRLDKNEIFYIGICEKLGRHKSARGRNVIWERIVAKTKYNIEIILDGISWEAAKQKETEFIKLYGRIDLGSGTLANMTDGGEGQLGTKGFWLGKKMPIASVEKMRAKKIGKPIRHLIGIPIPQKTRDAVRKHSMGNNYFGGKKHSDESKNKMSNAKKDKPTWLKKGDKWPSHIKHTCIGRKYSLETIEKFRRSQKSSPVEKLTIDGKKLEEYYSAAEAARKNDCFSSGIIACCKNKPKHLTYKGFIWKYKKHHSQVLEKIPK